MIRRLVIGLAMALVPCTSSAQSDLAQTLRLEDALRMARTNNPDYLKALNDADVAGAGVRQAWGAFLPQASADMGWNLSSSTTITGLDDFGEPIRREDPLVSQRSSASQGVGLSMTLFDGGRMLRNLSAARATVASTDAQIATQRSMLITRVTTDYYDAIRTLRLVEVEELNLASAQERQERTQAQFEIATASQVDVLQAGRNVVTAQQRLVMARANANKARLQLTQTIGVDATTPFELESTLPEVFDPSALDADALVARGLQVHPLMLQAEAGAATARARTSAARGTRWPTIRGSFGFNRGMSLPSYDALGEVNPQNRSWGGGISISLPIFQNFQTSYQIEQAEAQEKDASQERRRMALQVEREIRSALIDLESAYEGLQLATRSAEMSAEQMQLAEEQYRIGSLDFLQMQQLIDANLAAQRQAVDAQFAFITARATLEEKLGAPLDR
ncbi:MAG: TolC family protein [Longimicrobiales bacterium]